MKNRNLILSFIKTKDFEMIGYELKSHIRKAVKATLDYEGFPYDAELSVTFCDNEHIRKINSSYRGIDRPTDVLSFPMYEDGEFVMQDFQSHIMLGDIVLSLERVHEQALEFGNTPLREACFLAVHSTLHLLGYDHERSERDDEIQCQKQRDIMKIIEKSGEIK